MALAGACPDSDLSGVSRLCGRRRKRIGMAITLFNPPPDGGFPFLTIHSLHVVTIVQTGILIHWE